MHFFLAAQMTMSISCVAFHNKPKLIFKTLFIILNGNTWLQTLSNWSYRIAFYLYTVQKVTKFNEFIYNTIIK